MSGELIYPDWPAPANVRAFATTRNGGSSSGAWATFNLGTNSGDDSELVAANRLRLREYLPAEPAWLNQTHGNFITNIDVRNYQQTADASLSHKAGNVCAVLSADCLPLLLCEKQGLAVAAVHCGWRGLAAGIVEKCIAELGYPTDRLLAWMGPAIGPRHYEVGADVFAAFTEDSAAAGSAFTPGKAGRWQLDLYALLLMQLAAIGIESVYGGGYCTFSDKERFYSYRRDGVTGRQASVIWLE